MVCTYEPANDEFVSGSIQAGNPWEGDLTILLATMLNHYGFQSVLLDAGSNIGAHSLYAAALGHHVWSVDALTMNHVKVCMKINPHSIPKAKIFTLHLQKMTS